MYHCSIRVLVFQPTKHSSTAPTPFYLSELYAAFNGPPVLGQDWPEDHNKAYPAHVLYKHKNDLFVFLFCYVGPILPQSVTLPYYSY